MKTSLKGHTVVFRQRDKELRRRVIDTFTEDGVEFYLLFDPISQSSSQANASMFDQMFRAAGGTIQGQHYKGAPIGGAKQLQNI